MHVASPPPVGCNEASNLAAHLSLRHARMTSPALSIGVPAHVFEDANPRNLPEPARQSRAEACRRRNPTAFEWKLASLFQAPSLASP